MTVVSINEHKHKAKWKRMGLWPMVVKAGESATCKCGHSFMGPANFCEKCGIGLKEEGERNG